MYWSLPFPTLPHKKKLVHEDVSTRKWNSELPEHPANLTIEGGHLALDSLIQWNAIYSCSECRVHQHTHFYQGIRREAASKLRALPRRYNCFLKQTATGKGQQEKQHRERTGKATAEKERYYSTGNYTGLRLPLYIHVTTSSPLEKNGRTVSRIPGFCLLFANLLIWLPSCQWTSRCTFQLTSIIFKRTLLKIQLPKSLPTPRQSLWISWWKWGNSSCFYLVSW